MVIDGRRRALQRVHCVGIGGAGVGALAQLLASRGVAVSGSDSQDGPGLDAAAAAGAVVFVGHSPQHLHRDLDLVVHTAAVGAGHPEIAAARRLGLPTLKYARALGCLMEARQGIAVAGTHGKTTTSAMLAWVLQQAGQDPSFVIGGRVAAMGGAARSGAGDAFVAEACEFDRSFLHLRPCHAVVTGIDADHLDYYRDLDEIAAAFGEFLARVPGRGSVAVHAADPRALATARAVLPPRVHLDRFALADSGVQADWSATDLAPRGTGIAFQLLQRGRPFLTTQLAIPGRHNVLNACAAASVAARLGVAAETIAAALASFPGVERRFQVIHDGPEAAVVDDYAHHPTEISAVLEGARSRFAGRRICAVFQPHQHSRTRILMDALAGSLTGADLAIIPDIYASRDNDEDRRRVNSGELVARIRARGGRADHVSGLDQVLLRLRETVLPGDVVLVMGAGDVQRVAYALRRCLTEGRAA